MRIIRLIVPLLIVLVAVPACGGVSREDRMLLAAVEAGDIDRVRVLLDEGTDPNVLATGDFTLFHEAALRGHIEIMELLLAAGGDPAALDAHGDPAIRPVVLGDLGDLATAQWLLDHGMDPCVGPSDWLRSKGVSDWSEAARVNGHPDVAELLAAELSKCP